MPVRAKIQSSVVSTPMAAKSSLWIEADGVEEPVPASRTGVSRRGAADEEEPAAAPAPAAAALATDRRAGGLALEHVGAVAPPITPPGLPRRARLAGGAEIGAAPATAPARPSLAGSGVRIVGWWGAWFLSGSHGWPRHRPIGCVSARVRGSPGRGAERERGGGGPGQESDGLSWLFFPLSQTKTPASPDSRSPVLTVAVCARVRARSCVACDQPQLISTHSIPPQVGEKWEALTDAPKLVSRAGGRGRVTPPLSPSDAANALPEARPRRPGACAGHDSTHPNPRLPACKGLCPVAATTDTDHDRRPHPARNLGGSGGRGLPQGPGRRLWRYGQDR